MDKKNIDKLNTLHDPLAFDENDDLFSPSEKVWTNVANNLPIKKKRKKALPLLFLAMLFFASFFLFNLENKNDDIKSISNQLVLNSTTIKGSKTNVAINSSAEEAEAKSISTNVSSINKQKSEGRNKIGNSIVSASMNLEDKATQSEKYLGKKKEAKNLSNSNTEVSGFELFEKKMNKSSNVILAEKNVEKSSAVIQNEVVKEERSNTEEIKVISNEIENKKVNDNILSEDKRENKSIDLTQINSLSSFVKSQSKYKIEPLKIIQNKKRANSKWLLGLAASYSPMAFEKPSVSDPLEITIQNASYTSQAKANFLSNYTINKHLFVSINPGVRYDKLETNYNLDIPYNLNDEKNVNGKIENYFSHSLPTDLGNVKTNMVVTRNSDSPISDSEKINIEFDVNYSTIAVIAPVGINYAFKNISEGLYTGISFTPQLTIKRNIEVAKYLSHHTYVHEDHVAISKVDNFKKITFGADYFAGYRLPVSGLGILDLNANLHKNFSSQGRPFELNLGIGLVKSF